MAVKVDEQNIGACIINHWNYKFDGIIILDILGRYIFIIIL